MNQSNIQIIAARVRGLAKELLAIASQIEAQAPHLAVNLPRDLFSDLYAAAAERPKTGYLLQIRKKLKEYYPKLNLPRTPATSTNLALTQERRNKYDTEINAH